MQVCPNCALINDEGAPVCSSCGTRLAKKGLLSLPSDGLTEAVDRILVYLQPEVGQPLVVVGCGIGRVSPYGFVTGRYRATIVAPLEITPGLLVEPLGLVTIVDIGPVVLLRLDLHFHRTRVVLEAGATRLVIGNRVLVIGLPSTSS